MSWSIAIIIGKRLRAFREAKNLLQGDIQKRAGLFPSYVSRVENGHTIPAIETLEKFARALEVPLYQIFYEGEEPPKLPHLRKMKTAHKTARRSSRKEVRYMNQLRRLVPRIDESDRWLLLAMVQKMVGR